MNKLFGMIEVTTLFQKKPTIAFYPETDRCCGISLNVQKTHEKKVITLDIGEFTAKETVYQCSRCDRIYTSNKLKKLVSPWCNFGYDVLEYAGRSLFLDCINENKILEEFKRRNIQLSSRGLAYLANKFIIYLAIAHRESYEQIKHAMNKRGGYILHLDGTCDGDSPHLVSGLDGIGNLVLDNIKLPSEKAERIIPFLEGLKENFGNPLALVHDMGKGIIKAVETVFPGVADFICHFHFLRDIGKDLFGKENDAIRNRLKFHGVQGLLRKKANQLKNTIDKHPDLTDSLVESLKTGKIEHSDFENTPVFIAYSMIQWALDGKNQGKGYGFPFDRPYITFYERLEILYEECEKLQQMRLRDRLKDNKPFYKICLLLQNTLNDKKLRTAVLASKERALVFDRLRKAMRIADPEKTKGLNDNGEDGDIKTIEKNVKEFRTSIVNDAGYPSSKPYKGMVDQIDKYWGKLFADPITVQKNNETIIIQPQRTNNLLERFFRDIKRDYRKKSGLNSMSKTLKAMLVDTPLIKNLDNPDYQKILLNGKEHLHERLAEIDDNLAREEFRKSKQNSDKIPIKIRKMIKKKKLPEFLVNLVANQLELERSNQVLRS